MNNKIKVMLLIILVIFIIIFKITIPPFVKFSERRNVIDFAEKYLTKKYGEHNFKVTSVKYEFDMDYMKFFDYSKPVGYSVKYKNDILNDSYLTISGLNSSEYKVTYDDFLQNYYFPDSYGYERYDMLESIKPYEKINKELLSSIREKFDLSISSIENINILLNISDDFGRIPKLEELKNNSDFYKILSFTIYYFDSELKYESYEEKLKKYLNETYGDNWKIHFNSNGSISCSR